jgi:hypothetical protein
MARAASTARNAARTSLSSIRCRGANELEFIQRRRRQSGERETVGLQDLLRLPLVDQRPCQRHDDLCTVDAQPERLAECDLGGHDVAGFEQHLAEQHVYCQRILVDLQGVLELHYRTGRGPSSRSGRAHPRTGAKPSGQ